MKFLPILLASILPLSAQDTEREPKGLTVRTLALGLFEDISELDLRNSEGNPAGELALETQQLRERQKLKTRAFTFGTTLADGKTFRPLGNASLPPSGSDFILILVPVKDGYRALPLRSDKPDFKTNSAYLINLTTSPIGVALGTAKATLAPGKSTVLQPAYPADAHFYQATFYFSENGNPIPFNNSRWPVSDRLRQLVFIHTDPTTRAPTFTSVTDLAE